MMARDVSRLVWDVVSLGFLVFAIGMTAGVERALPLTQADAMAPGFARRLDLPEPRVREELTIALSEGYARRIAIRSLPFFVVGGLLVGRLIADLRERREPDGPGA